MISYRPKSLFQKDSELRESWQQMAGSSVLQRALAATQAEMATAGFGPNEMYGVTCFIVALLNLSENEDPIKPLPVKKLTSWDLPEKTSPEK